MTVYVVFSVGVTVYGLSVDVEEPLLHEYDSAPVAVSVAFCPRHIAFTGLILTVGNWLTVTVTVAVLEQPLSPVPVTVYVVVPVGVTVYGLTVDVVVPSFHEYDAAPLAVRLASCPRQIASWLVSAETVGSCLTLTVTLAVLEHPLPSVPVTVYVVVSSGVTDLLLPVPRLLPQEYEVAPVAVSVAFCPRHIAFTGLILTVGSWLTVTVTVAVLEQLLLSVPVTVYVVFSVGVTVYGLSVDVEVPLLHEYDSAPLALSVALWPLHIGSTALMLTEGSWLTVTVTVAVLLQLLASVPVTVYEVFSVGLTVSVFSLLRSPLQL